jgi:eukaryotic translation initiation factor 2C
VNRHLGLRSFCMTQKPNYKGNQCKEDISQYMANVIMKANLKLEGGHHTVQLAGDQKSKIQGTLQGTLVLGADLTHPGPGPLIGCPFIDTIVGSVDSAATKFRGSMRLQHTCKKEVSRYAQI